MWDTRFGIKLLALMTTGVEADPSALATSQWITSNPVMNEMLVQFHHNTLASTDNMQIERVINTFRTILKYVVISNTFPSVNLT
jgi:hypothetical protein